MKTPEKLNERDLEPRFEACLRGLVERVPFLSLTSLRKDVPVAPGVKHRADRVAKISAGGRPWTWVVEQKRLGQPREVRHALLQLAESLRHLPAGTSGYGVLLAPYLSEESARLCEEAGIGYADLAGNARLSFDQVFVETRVPGNPTLEKRTLRSLFAPKAARVLRVLLQGPLRAWKVAELARAADVSLGWVSAVRQQLLAHLWAVESPEGVRVTKPDAVLDAWAKADNWHRRTETREYSHLIVEPLELAEKLRDLLAPGDAPVFTKLLGGWLRRPYTTPVVVTAYVNAFPDEALLREKLFARRVPSGGTLHLVVPKDDGVRQFAQTARGLQIASDVQLYVDLIKSGLRGDDQARELRSAPDFSGGWA